MQIRRPDQAGPRRGGGQVVTVTDFHGAVIATITSAGARPTVVAVEGDVDLDTAPALEEALLAAIDSGPRTCLDMSRVTFFGAAGIQVVLNAKRRSDRLDRAFTLGGVHGMTRRVLTVAGLGALAAGAT